MSFARLCVFALVFLAALVASLPPVGGTTPKPQKKSGTTVLSADATAKTSCTYNCGAFQLAGKSLCTCPATNEITMSVAGVTSCPTFETLVFQTKSDQIRSVNTIKLLCESKLSCKCSAVTDENVEAIIPTVPKADPAPTKKFTSATAKVIKQYKNQKAHGKVLWDWSTPIYCPSAPTCTAPPTSCPSGQSVQKPYPLPGCPSNLCYRCMRNGTGISQ